MQNIVLAFFKQIQRFYLENRGEREATQIFKMEQLAYLKKIQVPYKTLSGCP